VSSQPQGDGQEREQPPASSDQADLRAGAAGAGTGPPDPPLPDATAGSGGSGSPVRSFPVYLAGSDEPVIGTVTVGFGNGDRVQIDCGPRYAGPVTVGSRGSRPGSDPLPLAGTPAAGRLVTSPVFLLSPTRSGSTLLRCLLNTHPAVHAPHKLHVGDLRVHFASPYARLSMNLLGLDAEELEHLLWDRLFDRRLAGNGKRVLVDKTPDNVLRWARLRDARPKARFVFLLRHPANILASAIEGGRDRDPAELAGQVLTYLTGLQDARQALPGLTVRYEDLVADPVPVLQQVCRFLGVEWAPEMLEYGAVEQGPFFYGVGDWGEKIRSGRVQPDRPPPEPAEIPDFLVPTCRAWGYLDDDAEPERRL
jgi:hypothetical protein